MVVEIRSASRTRLRLALLVLVYAAGWFVVGLWWTTPTDLDLTFWKSAQAALAGHPLLVYQPAGQLAYPNANGPLALVPLTLVGAAVQALGWMSTMSLRQAVAMGAFSVFIVLMAVEGVRAIERVRGARLGRFARPLSYGALLLAPPLWQSLMGFGHIEQPIEVWLVLLSVRWLNRGYAGRAGIAFALAVLARSSAAFLFIPIGFAAWRRGPGAVLRLAAAGAATGVAGLLPFYLADRADVVHSLLTFRASLPIGAGSVWNLARGTPLGPVGQHWDVAFIAASALAANLWLATRSGGLTEQRLFAGLALTSAGFVLLAKTVWPYYFMEAFVFVTIWSISRWKAPVGGWWKRAVVVAGVVLPPVVFSGLGLMAEIGSSPGQVAQVVAQEAGAVFILLAAWMLLVARTAGSSAAARASGEISP